jgi:DNA-binding transcriptional LysR family regulator
VTTLPRRLAQTMVDRSALTIVPLPVEVPAFSVSLAWHDRVHDDNGVKWLRERIIALASERLG